VALSLILDDLSLTHQDGIHNPYSRPLVAPAAPEQICFPTLSSPREYEQPVLYQSSRDGRRSSLEFSPCLSDSNGF